MLFSRQAQGGATFHHAGSDRHWLGLRQIHPLRQGEEDLHDRHPTAGVCLCVFAFCFVCANILGMFVCCYECLHEHILMHTCVCVFVWWAGAGECGLHHHWVDGGGIQWVRPVEGDPLPGGHIFIVPLNSLYVFVCVCVCFVCCNSYVWICVWVSVCFVCYNLCVCLAGGASVSFFSLFLFLNVCPKGDGRIYVHSFAHSAQKVVLRCWMLQGLWSMQMQIPLF